MSDAERTKNYFIYKLRKNYQEGKLDTSQVARGNRHKAGGYTWEYVNPAPDKRDNRGCNQPTAKKVRCAETGNQFVSLSDAARAVGLRNGNSIRRAIDRGGTAGGYHWEYLDEKRR